jgi:hypothetical protein
MVLAEVGEVREEETKSRDGREGSRSGSESESGK